jgi:uncharacterized RDD family membrane protein YckC
MSYPSRSVRNKTANFWTRYRAHLIDDGVWLAVIVVALVAGSATGLVVALLLVGPLNKVILEGLTGQSIGKRMAGLRVVKGNGSSPGVLGAAVRYTALVVDAALSWVPALISILRSPTQQRLGDRLAGTYVVDATRFAIRSYTDLEVGDRASGGLRMDLLGPDGAEPATLRATENWVAGWYSDPRDRDRLRWHDGTALTDMSRAATLKKEDEPRLDELNASKESRGGWAMLWG